MLGLVKKASPETLYSILNLDLCFLLIFLKIVLSLFFKDLEDEKVETIQDVETVNEEPPDNKSKNDISNSFSDNFSEDNEDDTSFDLE